MTAARQDGGEVFPDQGSSAPVLPRFACDAMCGGLARWLRALGHDAAWSEGIDDACLIQQAQSQGRILISSDSKLFERRILISGRVKSLFLPRGLRLQEQLEFVVRKLGLVPADMPRCMTCNGQLQPRRSDEVGHLVPARSLVWANRFFQCTSCGKVFWNGTHWRRIESVRQRFARARS